MIKSLNAESTLAMASHLRVVAIFSMMGAGQQKARYALSCLEQALSLRRKLAPEDKESIGALLRTVALVHGFQGDESSAADANAEADFLTRRSQVHCAGPRLQNPATGGRREQCAGCLRTHYCSVACQTADWRRKGGHKAECKALAAEGRAAAAAAK